MAMLIDLHTHSAVSDGTDSPAELVAHAAAAGLDVLAVTDHDTVAGLDEACAAGSRLGVEVLCGLELSARLSCRSVHLLGYGPDPENAALAAELSKLRCGRDDRVPAMVARLGDLGFSLELDEVLEKAAGVSVGRPHVADAMIARGYVRDREEAFTRWLYEGGPAYVDRYATELSAAIELIKAAGGVAVIAHPWGRGTDQVLTPDVLAELAASGLDGLEADHPDHQASTRAELRLLASRLGLLVTGGSDHHGTGKTRNPLGVCATDPAVYAEIRHRIH